jgi:hypothetical protein
MSITLIRSLEELKGSYESFYNGFKHDYNKNPEEYQEEFTIFVIDRVNQKLRQAFSEEFDSIRERLTSLETFKRDIKDKIVLKD